MEAALKALVQGALGEWVSDLDRIDASRFPLTLRDLELRPDKIQEEMSEDGAFPFDISNGKIGSLSVNPGWMGTVEVVATNIVLNFSFSPMKAVRHAMKGEEIDEEQEEAPSQQVRHQPPLQPAPAAPVAPRYCHGHSKSGQRPKVAPYSAECRGCGVVLQTNYAEFTLCPPCSDKEKRCMICGSHAPDAGNYIPAVDLKQQAAQQSAADARRALFDQRPAHGGAGHNPPGAAERMSSAPGRTPSASAVGGPSCEGLPPPPPPLGAPAKRAHSRPRADEVARKADSRDLPPPPPPFDRTAPSPAGLPHHNPYGRRDSFSSTAYAARGAGENPDTAWGSATPPAPTGSRVTTTPATAYGAATPPVPGSAVYRQPSSQQPHLSQPQNPWLAPPGTHTTQLGTQLPSELATPQRGSVDRGGVQPGGGHWRTESPMPGLAHPGGASTPAPASPWGGYDAQDHSRRMPAGLGGSEDAAGLSGLLKMMDLNACMAHGSAGAQRLRHSAGSALGRC